MKSTKSRSTSEPSATLLQMRDPDKPRPGGKVIQVGSPPFQHSFDGSILLGNPFHGPAYACSA